MLQPGEVRTTTRIVLASALAFRGTWTTAFDATQTAPRLFTLEGGERVAVPTMSGNVHVAIAAPAQQASVAVDEQGTVASGATGIVGGCGLLRVEPIAMAQPFVFVIRDRNDGSILFMDGLEDPREGA
jgi:serine protease inhibitor